MEVKLKMTKDEVMYLTTEQKQERFELQMEKLIEIIKESKDGIVKVQNLAPEFGLKNKTNVSRLVKLAVARGYIKASFNRGTAGTQFVLYPEGTKLPVQPDIQARQAERLTKIRANILNDGVEYEAKDGVITTKTGEPETPAIETHSTPAGKSIFSFVSHHPTTRAYSYRQLKDLAMEYYWEERTNDLHRFIEWLEKEK